MKEKAEGRGLSYQTYIFETVSLLCRTKCESHISLNVTAPLIKEIETLI